MIRNYILSINFLECSQNIKNLIFTPTKLSIPNLCLSYEYPNKILIWCLVRDKIDIIPAFKTYFLVSLSFNKFVATVHIKETSEKKSHYQNSSAYLHTFSFSLLIRVMWILIISSTCFVLKTKLFAYVLTNFKKSPTVIIITSIHFCPFFWQNRPSVVQSQIQSFVWLTSHTYQ